MALLDYYKKAMHWSTHPKAPWYMGTLAFLDASIFPISPMFMLLPMSFASPKRAFYFGAIASTASFLGGMLGYALGYYCFESFLGEFINWMGYGAAYQSAVNWFAVWGFWAVLASGFAPLPYKVFTISAGVLELHVGLFCLASLLSRILRFGLVAAIIYWGGPRVEPWIRRTLGKI